MKKTLSKLFALTMAVMLLMSMVLSVSALENYAVLPNGMVGGDSVKQFSDLENAGVFGLRVAKGTTVHVLACFLMEDADGKYILTHESVADYVNEGYELTIMVPGGTNIPAFFVAAVDEFDLAFLFAEGMDFYNPMKFTAKPFETTVVAGVPFANDQQTEARRVEYKAFNFADWTQINEILFALNGQDAAFNWLGCPIFHDTNEHNVQGIGTVYVNGGGDLIPAIIGFDDIAFPAELTLDNIRIAIYSGDDTDSEEETTGNTRETTTPTETPPPPNPPVDFKILIVVGLVIAAVVFYVSSNNKKKKEEAAKKAAAKVEPTIPVDPTLPVEPTKPQMTHGVTKAVSNWQLRATGGPLSGKTFPLSGTMKIGRSSKADIRFPDETPGVSGSHCEITVSGDSVTLQDVGSTYGTYVNGSRLAPHTPQKLHVSDSFALAQNGITFRLEHVGTPGNSQPAGPAVRDVQGKIYQAGNSGKLTFGRGSGNVVLLTSPDKQISSNHCVLYREGGKLYLKDVGSTNGTFFSEKERLKPNTPYRIRKGQAFFLCSPKFTFIVTEE